MKKVIKYLLRDPLLHFLLAGAVLFVVDRFWLEAKSTNRGKTEVLISVNDQRRLSDTWHMQWGRAPTDQEMQKLLANEIRERILYLEALRLHLDEGDLVLRRRLARKMEFLNQQQVRRPTKEELLRYYAKYSQKYVIPTRVSFSHIYFSPDIAGDPRQRAEMTLAKLQRGGSSPIRAPERGDMAPVRSDWVGTSMHEVRRNFGTAFAEVLETNRINTWIGPVQSGLGVHLLYMTSRIDSTIASFKEVEDIVLEDYMYDKRRALGKVMYEKIRSRYSVSVQAHPR